MHETMGGKNEQWEAMLHCGRMNRKGLAIILLLSGLALVFGWFGIDKFRNTFMWVGFLPSWMDGFLGYSKDIWIAVIGAIEILLAVMIVIPVRRVRQTGASLMALHLLGILTQVGWNDIAVRDIGLLMSSVALLMLL